MIDADTIFEQLGGNSCLWCGGATDGSDLAAAAEFAVSNKMPFVSVTPDGVGVMWPWLENTSVGIVARFYVDGGLNPDAASDLARRARTAFRRGAVGAQVFLRARDLSSFVSEIEAVRDDLFFNKMLSVGLDIGEIDGADWGGVYAALQKIRADSLLLALTVDRGAKSDFVGRVYGMLNGWGDAWRGDVHFALGGNFVRADQAWRLIEKMRPELAMRARFFINV